MDPLILLDQAESRGTIPKAISKKARSRIRYLKGAVARVEKASGIAYPPYYVEPVLPVTRSVAEYGQMGVLFARVIPTTAAGALSILVQFSAALLAFGAKGTVEAVAAHEFTHYVDLVRRLSRTEVLSDPSSSTLFESSYADTERTVAPKLVFADKALVSLVDRKFKQVLSDPRLNRQVEEKWVAKGLPVRFVPPEENAVRVAMSSVLSARFDPALLAKLKSMEEKKKA